MASTHDDALAQRRARPLRAIRRAEDVYYSKRDRLAGTPLAEWAFLRFPPDFAGRDHPDLSRRGQLDVSVKIVAEVNHGRWVARCPFCPSAQVVSPDDPRFLCAGADGCANGAVLGAFVPVEFPAALTRTAIEAALVVRPTENRNWTRGETVAQLRKENAANGLDNA